MRWIVVISMVVALQAQAQSPDDQQRLTAEIGAATALLKEERYAEGYARISRIIDEGVPAELRGKAHTTAALSAAGLRDHAGVEVHTREALRYLDTGSVRTGLSYLRAVNAQAAGLTDADVADLAQQAVAEARRHGDKEDLESSLILHGDAEAHRDPATARVLYEEARTMARERGDRAQLDHIDSRLLELEKARAAIPVAATVESSDPPGEEMNPWLVSMSLVGAPLLVIIVLSIRQKKPATVETPGQTAPAPLRDSLPFSDKAILGLTLLIPMLGWLNAMGWRQDVALSEGDTPRFSFRWRYVGEGLRFMVVAWVLPLTVIGLGVYLIGSAVVTERVASKAVGVLVMSAWMYGIVFGPLVNYVHLVERIPFAAFRFDRVFRLGVRHPRASLEVGLKYLVAEIFQFIAGIFMVIGGFVGLGMALVEQAHAFRRFTARITAMERSEAAPMRLASSGGATGVAVASSPPAPDRSAEP